MNDYWIAPSILSADFARLGDEVNDVLLAGADLIHFDVMDNHYVPNLTFGPAVCASLREYGITAPIDVHLMASPVDRLILDFAKAGADIITVHHDATIHLDRTIDLIKQQGCRAGVVLNPASPLMHLEYIMDKLDWILLMSVNPGFGGQAFITSTLDKIKAVRTLIEQSGRDIRLQVDGGININNIAQVAKAGADTFVAGSAIFGQKNYQETIDEMRRQLASIT